MEVAAPRFFGGTTTRLLVNESSLVGQCRRNAQRLAESQGFTETSVGRLSIVATELGNNLVRHAGGGELFLQVLGQAPHTEIEVLALDRGPGIHNVARSLQDGFSTAGTPGTGLGAVSRLSNQFDIYSQPGRGTAVFARIACSEQRKPLPLGIEFGALSRPIDGESDCGDSWKIAVSKDTVAVLVADGLGHGMLAARAGDAAAAAFSSDPFAAPAATLQRIHLGLTGGRGAAAACAVMGMATTNMAFTGVGNISASVLSPEGSRGMVSHNGILGVQSPRRQQFDYTWPVGSRILLHSDGVSARWSLEDYPGLFQRHCALMAAVIYRDHGRPRDDASIVVIGRHT